MGRLVIWAVTPLAFFIATMLAFDLAYHAHPIIVLTSLGFLFLGSLSPMFAPLSFPCCFHGWAIKESSRGFAAVLFLFTLSGALISVANYQHNIGPTLDFDDLQWYRNVLPTERKDVVADAVALTFASGTAVSTSQSAGYKSLETGNTVYCAAPILNASNADNGDTDFWAVGTDCCDAKSSFWCDEANDSNAHDGIILTDTSYSFLSPRRANREAFLKAIELVRHDHAFPVREPLLVKWILSASETKSAWAARGEAVFGISIGAAAGIALIVGVLAAATAPVELRRPAEPLSEWKDEKDT